LAGFTDAGPQQLEQILPSGARRLWRVDTLLPDVAIGLRTPASIEGSAWLDSEADVLLRR
jgi:hypothetical protein